jgi:hypothetical protein
MDLPQGNCGLVLQFVHIAQLHYLYTMPLIYQSLNHFPLLNILTPPFKRRVSIDTNLFHWMLKKSYSQQCLVLLFANLNAHFSY